MALNGLPYDSLSQFCALSSCTEKSLLLWVHNVLLPLTQKQLILLNKTSVIMLKNHVLCFLKE